MRPKKDGPTGSSAPSLRTPRRSEKTPSQKSFQTAGNKRGRGTVVNIAASVAFETVSKGRPTHDHSHPHCTRRICCRSFAQPGAGTCRLRPGQDGQGRRHEERHHVQGRDEEGHDVKGRHEEG